MANFANLNAAADKISNGAIIVPEFQTEIVDLIRRAGVFGQRIEYVPATGTPSRFFEQNDIAEGGFTDPNTINPTAINIGAQRVEKSVLIKAVTSQVNYGLFDMETVAQQGIFTQLKAKDLKDMVNGMIRLKDKGIWTGTDTVSGAQVGGGVAGNMQYVGVLSQVATTMIIDTTASPAQSIVDSLRTKIASMLNDPSLLGRPSAIYMNPMALDKLEQEVKNANSAIKFIQTDISDGKVGVSVSGLVTAAGVLPIIPEPFLAMDAPVGATPIAAAVSPKHNYPFAIMTEDLVEFHYVGEKNPRVFQLATQAGLAEQYVGIQFGAPVVKYAGKQAAHVVGVVIM